MTYRLNYEIQTPEKIKYQDRDTFRLLVTILEAEDMPTEVFLHQKTLVDPHTAAQQDEFCAICSPYDLSYYPASTPNPAQNPAFFRKSVIDIYLPGLQKYDEVVAAIKEQLAHLIDMLENMDTLSVIEDAWLPSAPTTTTSTTTSSTTTTTTTGGP